MHTVAIFAALPITSPVQARTSHVAHGDPRRLREPGQGTFAALAEVVARFEADPAADRSRVDLGAPRDHLVDMDRLVRDAVVTVPALPGGSRFEITGGALTLAAAGRMVPALAREPVADPAWHAPRTLSRTACRSWPGRRTPARGRRPRRPASTA